MYTKFDQVKVRLLDYIRRRNLRAGDLVPSQSELVRDSGYSLITVRRALSDLAAAGIIAKSQGRRARLVRNLNVEAINGKILLLHIFHTQQETTEMEAGLRLCFSENGFELVVKGATHPVEDVWDVASTCNAIMVIGWLTKEWVTALKATHLPIVVLGNNPFPELFPTVNYDRIHATKLLYDELRQGKQAKIGIIVGSQNVIHNRQILETYLKCAEQDKFQEIAIVETIPDICENTAKVISRFLAKANNLDAVIVPHKCLLPFLLLRYEQQINTKLRLGILDDFSPFKWYGEYVKAVGYENKVQIEGAEFLVKCLKSGDFTPRTHLIRACLLH